MPMYSPHLSCLQARVLPSSLLHLDLMYEYVAMATSRNQLYGAVLGDARGLHNVIGGIKSFNAAYRLYTTSTTYIGHPPLPEHCAREGNKISRALWV